MFEKLKISRYLQPGILLKPSPSINELIHYNNGLDLLRSKMSVTRTIPVCDGLNHVICSPAVWCYRLDDTQKKQIFPFLCNVLFCHIYCTGSVNGLNVSSFIHEELQFGDRGGRYEDRNALLTTGAWWDPLAHVVVSRGDCVDKIIVIILPTYYYANI